MKIKGTGTYYRDDRGYYCWRIYVEKRATVRKAKSSKELREKVKAALSQIDAGHLHRIDRTITVKELVDIWLDEFVDATLSPNTARHYRQMAELYILPAIGSKRVVDLNANTVQFALNRITAGPATRNRARQTIKAALDHAVKSGLISTNPAIGTTRAREPDAEPKPLPAEILESFTNEALRSKQVTTRAGDTETRLVYSHGAILVFMAYTGIRITEAIAVKSTDIDLESNRVQVLRRIHDFGKSGWEFANLKTKASRRTIPLSATARRAILVNRSSAEYDDSPHQLEFHAPGGDPLNPRNIQRSFDSILQKIGADHYSLHDLRDTFATNLARRGTPPKTLQVILGHSEINTTMKHYVGVYDDDLALVMADL